MGRGLLGTGDNGRRDARRGNGIGLWIGMLALAAGAGCTGGASPVDGASDFGGATGNDRGGVQPADVVFDPWAPDPAGADAGAGPEAPATAPDAPPADPDPVAPDAAPADPDATVASDNPGGTASPDAASADRGPGADVADTDDDARDAPVPDPFETLCQPCLRDSDCAPPGGDDGLRRACMDLGAHGSYCGVECQADADCPADHRCLAAPGVLPVVRQCVPRTLRCPCTQRFVLGGFRTRCDVTSAHGTCSALRTCDQACPAATPAPESCNGRDDDCDGSVDEATDAQCFPGACDPAAGACRSSCAGPGDCTSAACCSGTCRDLQRDRFHCGSCQVTCRNDHGTTSCQGGTCRPACDAAYGDCDALRSNGCEASLRTLDDCGACDRACTRPGGQASCATGACLLAGCEAGHASCDGDDANGCETDLGAAGNACATAEWIGSTCGDQSCGAFCSAADFRSLVLRSGRGGRWFRVALQECSGCCADLQARITLDGPAGVDYDLYVWGACGTLLGSSTRGPGQSDEVRVTRADGCTGGDSSVDLHVEVRHHSGATCEPWTLGIDGTTCN